MKMVKVFITNIIAEEKIHIIEDFYLHDVICDCMLEDGRVKERVHLSLTQSDYKELMEKGYFEEKEAGADSFMDLVWD